MIESNPLSESDEEATSMDLFILFSSSEEAPNHLRLLKLTHTRLKRGVIVAKLGELKIKLAIIHKEAEHPQKDIKPVGLEILNHILFTFLFCFFIFKGKGMWYL